MKTHQPVLGISDSVRRGERSRGWLDFPVLETREGGLAERLARSCGGLHPAIVFIVVMLTGLAAIALLSIGLGFLVTRVLEHASGIGATEQHFNLWLATHRTPSRTEASLLGSIAAGGVVLPIIAGSTAFVCALLRKWRVAAFLVFALGVESATYRATTLVVHSHRPRVPRLESLPVNASYPSGHTAATIAVYGGIVLLLTSRFTNSAFRAVAWIFVPAMVAFVAMSRMYRGMHHPLDVAGGIVIGIVAVSVVALACRTAGATAELHNGRGSVGRAT